MIIKIAATTDQAFDIASAAVDGINHPDAGLFPVSFAPGAAASLPDFPDEAAFLFFYDLGNATRQYWLALPMMSANNLREYYLKALNDEINPNSDEVGIYNEAQNLSIGFGNGIFQIPGLKYLAIILGLIVTKSILDE